MNASEVLYREMLWFLFALAALLTWRMLTRGISMKGLLRDKTGSRSQLSPERVQVLVSTLALSATIIRGVLHSTNGMFPDISGQWLVVFGGSTGVYAGVKALKTFRRRV